MNDDHLACGELTMEDAVAASLRGAFARLGVTWREVQKEEGKCG